MQRRAEVYEEIEQINLEDREGKKEEIVTLLNKVQDEAFMKGYEYAIKLLKESIVALIDDKDQTT